jgi:Ca2+-binding RTX toxin-like protein
VRLTPDGILQIIGTEDNDFVIIEQLGRNHLIVHANFLQNGNFETFAAANVAKIIAYLHGGNDHLIIAGNVAVPAIVHGGAGNDLLKAGGGPSVLLGDEGDDILIGGRNRDIIIGGLGADFLIGGIREDILIGGTTTHDHNDQALMDLMTEWNDSASYSVRTDRLRGGTGATGIQLAKGVTVFDDHESDWLFGFFGTDWFFFDPAKDTTPDRKNNEEVN